jgi:hypothetical protein
MTTAPIGTSVSLMWLLDLEEISRVVAEELLA